MSLLDVARRIFKKRKFDVNIVELEPGMSEKIKIEQAPVFDIKKWQLDNTVATKGNTPHILEIVPTSKNTKSIGANWLFQYHHDQHSEHGEDGIIAKIFEILKPENKWVCEFGAHDPEIISNTWRLINNENWNAVLIEGDDKYFEKLHNYYQARHSVHCIHAMVGCEGKNSLDNLLGRTPVPRDLDFMVIDIDGNDYHVWEAIQHYAAKVIMIEFNASIPVEVGFVQDKNEYLNQGSSIKAFTELATRKGYSLIATTAWNAIFVKNEYYRLFFQSEPALEDMYIFPAKHPINMRAFQLYDGTIVIAPWNEMLWHKIDLKPNDYQVLPDSFRFFSREIYYQDKIFECDGTRMPAQNENKKFLEKIFSMPGNKLAKYAHNYYSRYGEDGILAQIIKLIPCQNKFFIDIGAWDGVTFSRSRHLAYDKKWSGILIESEDAIREMLAANCDGLVSIKIGKKISDIDKLLNEINAPCDIDVIFINVFGMEYYIWESMIRVNPKIIAIQFNPTIQNDVKYIQPNDSAINQGCSLRALTELGSKKGYKLAAVTLETAFFVRIDYANVVCREESDSHDLDQIFSPAEMLMFQLYDGTIRLRGLNRMMWNGIRIDEERIQVVPKGLRRFHQFATMDYKKYFYRV